MAFRHFLKKAEWGVAMTFSQFFLCSGLEHTLRTPKKSFLMKKVKNHRKKWHSAISWKRRTYAFCSFPPLSATFRLFPPFRLFQDPNNMYHQNTRVPMKLLKSCPIIPTVYRRMERQAYKKIVVVQKDVPFRKLIKTIHQSVTHSA